MRFLFALMMAFAVFVSIPTLAAADVDAPMELTDSQDVFDVGDAPMIKVLDAEIPSRLETFAVARFVQRVPLPMAVSTRTGPNGFIPEIWRPVDRADSTLLRNYESGLSLNRS